MRTQADATSVGDIRSTLTARPGSRRPVWAGGWIHPADAADGPLVDVNFRWSEHVAPVTIDLTHDDRETARQAVGYLHDYERDEDTAALLASLPLHGQALVDVDASRLDILMLALADHAKHFDDPAARSLHTRIRQASGVDPVHVPRPQPTAANPRIELIALSRRIAAVDFAGDVQRRGNAQRVAGEVGSRCHQLAERHVTEQAGVPLSIAADMIDKALASADPAEANSLAGSASRHLQDAAIGLTAP